jgi:hypothetical protein
MPSRSTKRRRRRAQSVYYDWTDDQIKALAAARLEEWRAEAVRRAKRLGEPAVWNLQKQFQQVADDIDSSGELREDLNRVCAEAVASIAGRHLVPRPRLFVH